MTATPGKSRPARQPRGAPVPAGYSGTPLPRKLGIKPDSVVALVNSPPGFEKTLGDLPEGATLRLGTRGRADLTIWFCRERRHLEKEMARMASRGEDGRLWIAWPKKTSPLAGDITENHVRDAGLAAGLVDFKVCAIDGDWSGLKFARRKAQ